jgi:predicted metal-dependent hydrolase
VEYRIVKSKKRKNSIEFRIVDGEIIVYTPIRNVSKEIINKCFEKHKNNLLQQLKNTENVTYLGKSYGVVWVESPLLRHEVCEINNNNFVIYKPKGRDVDFFGAVKAWQIRQAKKIIPERVKFFVENYNFNFSFELNTIKFKNQKTRWGSCSGANNLNFNYKIMEKDMEILDYLVTHELAHTLVKNHSHEFWKIVGKIIPNYENIKKRMC